MTTITWGRVLDLFVLLKSEAEPQTATFGRLNPKMAYALGRNLRVIDQDLEDYRKMEAKFYDQRNLLIREYATLNEEGEPVQLDGQFQFSDPERRAQYQVEFEKMADEYGPVALAKMEVEIDLTTVEEKYFPDLTLAQMRALEPMYRQEMPR